MCLVTPVVWARGLDVGRRFVQCWHHGGVFLYVFLRMEDCPYRAGSWDVQADCAEQVLRVLRVGWRILSVGFLALLFVPGSPGMLGTAPLIALVAWIVWGLVSWAITRRQLKDMPPERTAALVLE